jgi:hypothetical protein
MCLLYILYHIPSTIEQEVVLLQQRNTELRKALSQTETDTAEVQKHTQTDRQTRTRP